MLLSPAENLLFLPFCAKFTMIICSCAMEKTLKRLAPNQITELSQCEIFVFGSNLEGQHMGGAARYAYEHFSAEWGNGVGP